MYFFPTRGVSTFSICAVDPETGTVGAAVASRYIAVGALVPFVSCDAGAVLTQSVANPRHGIDGLRLLAEGVAPAEALGRLLEADEKRDIRQTAILSLDGSGATHSGPKCVPLVAEERRPGVIALGNTLASSAVPAAMVEAYLGAGSAAGAPGAVGAVRPAAAPGDPGDGAGAGAAAQAEPGAGPPKPAAANRMAAALLAALEAGEAAGGDKRGKQAAALLVAAPGGGYGGIGDRAVDLRVDDHRNPIGELSRILDIFLENQREEFGGDEA